MTPCMKRQRLIASVLMFAYCSLWPACQPSTLKIIDSGTRMNPLNKMGELAKSEVWGGKVLVSGDVLVPEGLTLTIQSGTVIGFEPADPPYRLIIHGTLYAEGGPESFTTFGSLGTLNKVPKTGDWGGVHLAPTSQHSRLSFCRLQNAKEGVICESDSIQIQDCLLTNNETAIVCDNSQPLITRNQLNTNDTAIRCINNATPYITYNEIKANQYGISCEDDARPQIQRNEIFANYRDAILCYSTASPEIISNNILMNGGWAVYDGGRLRDNFIRGNNDTDVGTVEVGTGRDSEQFYGTDEVFDPRSSPVSDAGIPRAGY